MKLNTWASGCVLANSIVQVSFGARNFRGGSSLKHKYVLVAKVHKGGLRA